MGKKDYFVVLIVIISIGIMVAAGSVYYLRNHTNRQDNSGPLTIETTPSTNINDPQSRETAVVSVVRAYALKNGYANPIISVDIVNNTQARGNIGDESVGGGAKWFAASINDQWTVVHLGNGLPECNFVSKYNLSKEFLNCY